MTSIRKDNRCPIRLLAFLLFIFTYAFVPFISRRAHASDLALTLNDHNQFIALSGVLDPGTAEKLHSLIVERAPALPTVLIIESTGGALDEIPALTREIVQLGQFNFIQTGRPLIIAFNIYCGSACTILAARLTQARAVGHFRILVDPDLAFGFHGPVLKQNGRFFKLRGARRKAERQREIQAYLDAGVNPAWLKARHRVFDRDRLTRFSAEEICEAGVGIVPPDACLPVDIGLFPFIDEL